MQALILAGGQGTRLRPLTLTTPKPVLPLAGRPFLVFMLDWLAAQGVTEAILSCGFMAERVARVLGHRYGEVSLRYVTEPEPLGTAGPLRLAVDEGGIDERLLVLNGDLLTDLDLSAQIELHAARGAIATLALVSVEDSSSYGLVPTAADGEVEAFLEKTGAAGDAPPPTNRVNGGVYVVERAIVERIPAGRAVSFEREVFPGLVGNGLFGHASDAYWIDIGTPERYLEATHDLLSGRVDSALPARDEGGSLIFPGCRVEGAEVGPLSVLGEGAIVDRRARVVRSVLYPEARVGEGAMVDGAVLAEGVVVGAGARVGEGAVIGAQTRVDDGATVEPRARVDPGVVFPATRADARAAGYQCVHGPHSGHPAPGGSLSREERDPSGGSAMEAERSASGGEALDPAAIAAVDSRGMVHDIEAQGHQLIDAVWRVESAGIAARARPGGLVVCGMGGSAIGGDLAAGAIGGRARARLSTVRGYTLAPALAEGALVLCASYSGDTEETLACYEAAGAARAERVALTTGGTLAEAARSAGVPVIGVPAGLQPRAAVAYMLVAAVECAALAAAAPSLRTEIEAAARLLERLAAEWGPAAGDEVMPKRLARRLHGRMPVVYGAGATASVALRWKAQINENAKVPAFWSELPEADHNELVGWEGASGLAPLAAIFLDDAGAERALRRRLSLTASEIAAFEDPVEQIPSFGRSPLERVAAAVMLGDFVSLYLAALRGVDPTPVETIARFKRKLAEESRPVR